MVAIALLLSSGAVGQEGSQRLRTKVWVLLHLAEFAEWPQDSFPPSALFRVCVLGDPLLAVAMQGQVAGRQIHGQKVEVQIVRRLEQVRQCRLAFVGVASVRHVAPLLESLQGSNVLTVSEAPGFCQAGGVVEMTEDADRYHFRVNMDAAESGRLGLRAQFLALAELVHPGK